MAHKTFVVFLFIGADSVLVHIVQHRFFDGICFRETDAAALIFHDLVAACPVKACVGFIFITAHREDHFVAVIVAGGGGKNGDFFQIFACQAVQVLFYPVSLQPAFFLVGHMPEIAAAAKLGNGTFPVDAVGGFFDHLGDLSQSPGLVCL